MRLHLERVLTVVSNENAHFEIMSVNKETGLNKPTPVDDFSFVKKGAFVFQGISNVFY